ncbi:MAG: type II toxin-antitoxin system Phd/YefM family antitoxin [Desulfobacterales bacterium]|nr:type II toxin-antitoxin system Phd/YefM family antitoxin [Desulfobacterales bacterium]
MADAKKRLSAIVKDVDENFDRFAITRNGVSKAVIISSEEHEGLLETLDILSFKAEREAIARAKKQVKKGETVSLESIKKRGDFFIDNFLLSSKIDFDIITKISTDNQQPQKIKRQGPFLPC